MLFEYEKLLLLMVVEDVEGEVKNYVLFN